MPGLAVIARQRSGTNFLRSLIAASSNLVNVGEVFDIKAASFDINFFRWRVSRGYRETHPRGEAECIDELLAYFAFLSHAHPHHVVDIKYDQTLLSHPTLQSPGEPYPVFAALARAGYGVVHLVRENVCANLVSHRVASVSGVWHVPREVGAQVRGVKVRLEPKHFMADIARRVREAALFDSFCADLPGAMRMRYETLHAADDAARAKMLRCMCRSGGGSFAYVGHPAFTKSLGHWLDYIENRDEIVTALSADPAFACHLGMDQ